jgi:hypothetical protein
MWAAADRGEIALGGCVLSEENLKWHCAACEREFA